MTGIVVIAVALGMDAFSFSLAIGLSGVCWSAAARLALTIGVFHIAMPLLGLYLGKKLGFLLGDVAVVLGVVILLYLGLRMILKAHGASGEMYSRPDLRAAGMLALAFSVSVDAFSVGFSLGTMTAPVAVTAMVMGAVAAVMTLCGVFLGRRIGTRLGNKAEIAGGLILVLIGLRMGWEVFI